MGRLEFQFTFARDPNFEETLSAFEHSVQWAAEGKFTEQDIEEAKISVLAQVSSAYTAFA